MKKKRLFLKVFIILSLLGLLAAIILLETSIFLWVVSLEICILTWSLSSFYSRGKSVKISDLEVGTRIEVLHVSFISDTTASYLIMTSSPEKGYPEIMYLEYKNYLRKGHYLEVTEEGGLNILGQK